MTVPAVHDTGITLAPDPGRVITRFFVPGREDVGPGDSRAGPVLERILGLKESEVEAAMADIDDRFAHRHRALDDVFAHHASLIASRLDDDVVLSPQRWRLVGASFTHEFAIEAAALCNPSIVEHPDQPVDGETAFVLSVRSIGEGHRSSIGFRTGVVSSAGCVIVDPAGPFPQAATAGPGTHQRAVLHRKLAEVDEDRENAAFVLDPLPAQFSDAELQARVVALVDDSATRRHAHATAGHVERLGRASYRADFPAETELSERVLWPHSPPESHGIEDARFVRFTDDDGSSLYYATYTAYDGVHVVQHLLTTNDFRSFAATPMAGAAATGKGLALFPRRVGGRYAALSRSDRETNAVAFSDDVHCWDAAEIIQAPTAAWELLQLGNCGSPIETADGWLVLTHGVGAMRTYCLGALLLDLEDPARVLAHSDGPILGPGHDRRDGYVPNVVYTCGALAVGDLLVLPYGVGDQTIAVATLSIADLLGTLRPTSTTCSSTATPRSSNA